MEFRVRNYRAEDAACALPRSPTDYHPLIPPSAPSPSPSTQVDEAEDLTDGCYDPLRRLSSNVAGTVQGIHDTENTIRRRFSDEADQLQEKEWDFFKKSLLQKHSTINTITVSSSSDVIIRSTRAHDKLLKDAHLEQLDDPASTLAEGFKTVTRQEYVTRLHELKDDIGLAWRANDRLKALKLSIKVVKLLSDTSVMQFYPALFILVTDILDFLGDLVWERIKRKAEYDDNGVNIYCLSEDFESVDVCDDAKETCYNWFCKVGSVRELLPRIYLELAIFHCRRFLGGHPSHELGRISMMLKGLADPLASVYCHLYMVRCAQKSLPGYKGHLITSMKDISFLLRQFVSVKEVFYAEHLKDKKLVIALTVPVIEWIMKCIFKNVLQSEVEDIFEELGLGRTMSNVTGNVPGISVVFHHLLRELSADIVSLYALNTIQLFEHYKDISIDQHLNYRLLGLKLSESQPPVDSSKSIINRVLQVISHYETLNEYLVTVEAYLDLILQYQMDNYLAIILDGISTQVFEKRVTEDDSDILQSVLVKLINHFNDIEDVFALNHFTEILDVLNGISRDVINTHILIKATRSGYIHDPSILERLFDVAQSLHGSIDFLSLDVDCQERARLITRFVQMVDFGSEKEHHLTFLVECRAAFGKLNLLKETLVHSCNNIAMKAIKDVKKFPGFVKACITFNEVTIPSVSTGVRRIYLYLETAEVALLGGLISHADGLINSAVSCLQDSEWTDGLLDVDGVLSSTCKLCSMIISLPGNPEGLDYFPKSILYLVDSQSWITLGLRMKMLCAIVSLSAALSQKEFPYLVNNRWVERKDLLFLGEPSSYNKLGSFCHLVLQNLIDSVEQEPQKVERGKLALQACNCLMMAYEASHEVASICSRLMGIAKSCLHADDTYMLSTMNVFDKRMSKLISDVTHVS